MILLQMYFQVDANDSEHFIGIYRNEYVTALEKQSGFLRSSLLRVYDSEFVVKLSEEQKKYNYQMELVFQNEKDRLQWVATPEHEKVWLLAKRYVQSFAVRGYDVIG